MSLCILLNPHSKFSSSNIFVEKVGLPHYGYNKGPHPDFNIHHFGLWGQDDETVPPKESPSAQGCSVPCRTTEPGGWFYTSAECVMEKWKSDLELVSDDSVVNEYDIPNYDKLLECSGYASSSIENGPVVLGCVFDGGHDTDVYHDEVTLNFFDVHSKVRGSSFSPSTEPSLRPSEVRAYPKSH